MLFPYVLHDHVLLSIEFVFFRFFRVVAFEDHARPVRAAVVIAKSEQGVSARNRKTIRFYKTQYYSLF